MSLLSREDSWHSSEGGPLRPCPWSSTPISLSASGGGDSFQNAACGSHTWREDSFGSDPLWTLYRDPSELVGPSPWLRGLRARLGVVIGAASWAAAGRMNQRTGFV